MAWCARGTLPTSASTSTMATLFSGSRSLPRYSSSMQSPASDANRARGRRPLTLWLILAACAAPIVASYVAYYLWRPTEHVNYGELIEPRPLPESDLATFDGA